VQVQLHIATQPTAKRALLRLQGQYKSKTSSSHCKRGTKGL